MKKESLSSEGIRLSNAESNFLTRESLQMALIYLMNKMPFEKITITEIVKKAGVSRMAFYRNYSSKEDILEKLKNEVMDSLKLAIVNLKNGHGNYETYYSIFLEIKEKAVIIKLLLKANFATTFMLENILFFDDLLIREDKNKYYGVIACIGAVLTVATRWFVEGMNESVEFMANYCAKNIGFY